MNNYDELINKWHKKARQEKDFFTKFIFEYLSFIAYIKTKSKLYKPNDRNCIQELKQNNDIKEKYFLLIKQNTKLRQNWEEIKNKLDEVRLGNSSYDLTNVEECNWWNCYQKDLNMETLEEKSNIKGVINSLENWSNMIEFWYVIRNNLFHGAKSPENERDLFVMEYGYKTLSRLMNLLLEE